MQQRTNWVSLHVLVLVLEHAFLADYQPMEVMTEIWEYCNVECLAHAVVVSLHYCS